MSDLISSPCPKRNYQDSVCLLTLHSTVVAFSEAVFSSLFLFEKAGTSSKLQ